MNNIHNVEKLCKYQQLAKDAQSNGDPVLVNYLQHADHCLRRYNELYDEKMLLKKRLKIVPKEESVEKEPRTATIRSYLLR